ncbi:MAG: DUF58 domain-containing protein [Candidatus Latescibacterota bacterium]
MIPREILDKVRRIEIQTRSVVNELFAGEYHSVFKGRGMEFAEVREYQPGDDVRSIDWNVTARVGSPFVKVYDEERELTVMLVVDGSSSMAFGSGREMKDSVAAKISAILAFSAIKNKDRVGLLIFARGVQLFIPPKKGRRHVLRVIREVLSWQPEEEVRGTSISSVLEYLNQVLHRRSIVFLISDFMLGEEEPAAGDGHGTGLQRALQLTRHRHDLIAVTLRDPRERHLPDVGFITLQDAETGELLLVDTHSARVRAQFAAQRIRGEQGLSATFRRLRVDQVSIDSADAYVEPLVTFFRTRMRRK